MNSKINRRLEQAEARLHAAMMRFSLTPAERQARLEALEARAASGIASPVEIVRLARIRALLARVRRRIENERLEKEG